LDYESLWLKENYFIYIGDPINKFYKITRREAFELSKHKRRERVSSDNNAENMVQRNEVRH